MSLTKPLLYRRTEVPAAACARRIVDGREQVFGGDIRLGDLTGDGRADLLVYRSADDAHDGGGMKPVFLAAFTLDGEVLWIQGDGGEQPSRPGPVIVHDIDADGAAEVICLFRHGQRRATAGSLADTVVQVRCGRTGQVHREAAPAELTACQGRGPNWVHQRLLACDLRGLGHPRDLVVKLGATVLALTDELEVLWTYTSPWTEYSRCPSYIPAVGDIDGDGRDEVLGGYWLLDEDGTPLWEAQLAPNMDSVAMVPWDGGRLRAVCSGGGHVLDEDGGIVLALGEDLVPHGQEVRVARFTAAAESQMVIRYAGHDPRVVVVDTTGAEVARTTLNESPNNTGMEAVYWNGPDAPALLFNGGRLWDPVAGTSVGLPDLPVPEPVGRMSWYHCIPADVCGDGREELVLYNPWTRHVYIYTPAPLGDAVHAGYRPTARQYNVRLMD